MAENVVRVARCPMLIVKGAEPADARLKLIICPVDFGVSAADSLQVAAVLAAVMRAKLEIVTAVDKAEIAGGATEERLHAWVPEGLRRMCDLSETVLCGDAAERIIERLRAWRRGSRSPWRISIAA